MIDQGIYTLYVDYEDANVFMTNAADEEALYKEHFLGNSIAEDFKLPKFKLISSRKTSMRDFMYGHSQAPILSQRAHDALFDLINQYVEFVNIGKYKGSNYFFLNTLAVVNALDEKLSDVTYSEEDPERVIVITKYVFKTDIVNDLPIFKIPQRLNMIFVTTNFVNEIIEHKLTGVFVENPLKTEISKANPLFGLPFK